MQGTIKPTALKPRDPTATAAAALRSKAAHKGGSSLSSLLQSRSEYAATNKRQAAAVALSPLPDIDSKDKANPLAEAGYAHDIYCFYRRVEPRFAVPSDYMTSQVGVGRGHRSAGWGPCLGPHAAPSGCGEGGRDWQGEGPNPVLPFPCATSSLLCRQLGHARPSARPSAPAAQPRRWPSFQPRPTPLCSPGPEQAEINEKMRSILIDWLIEVHLKFKVSPPARQPTITYA